MFEIDRFIANCQTAVASGGSSVAVREVMAEAVSDPAAVLAALGEPQRAGINLLFRSPTSAIPLC